MIVLDTHVWIWLLAGEARRIGRKTRRLIARAATVDAVRVSVATLFEIVALHASGRLRLSRPPDQWLREALDLPGTRLAPLTGAMAIDAGYIPRAALPDPLDRLLVATARQLDAAFVTGDARILEYARVAGQSKVRDAAA